MPKVGSMKIENRNLYCPHCKAMADTLHKRPHPTNPDLEIRICEECEGEFESEAYFVTTLANNTRPDLV